MKRRMRARLNPGPKLPVLYEADPDPTPQMIQAARAPGRTARDRGATLEKPGWPSQLLVVAYGMGVDSTAMLVAMVRSGIRPDLILFADTGGEQPHTYAYLPIIQQYLAMHGFPPVIVVRNPVTKSREGRGVYETLQGECLVDVKLPSPAYGGRTCSQKWKIAPQRRFISEWGPAKQAWKRGERILQAIGPDAGARTQRAARWAIFGVRLRLGTR